MLVDTNPLHLIDLGMHFLARTLETPAANLALDEALLEIAEGAQQPWEGLRVWESPQAVVVVGRASRIDDEVNVPACRELRIPILRRTSGGAAVVAGPGCFMYSVVLSHELHPEVQAVDRAHAYVLDRLVTAIAALGLPVQRQGTSDLVLHGRKVSGNSCRCRRKSLLYHGTLLYAFPLSLISTCLKEPPRQPAYRHRRPHSDFVANLTGVTPVELEESLRQTFSANRELTAWPRETVERLVAERFDNLAWTELR